MLDFLFFTDNSTTQVMVKFRKVLCTLALFSSGLLNNIYCGAESNDKTVNTQNDKTDNLMFHNEIIAVANTQPLTLFQFEMQLQLRGIKSNDISKEEKLALWKEWVTTSIERNAMLKHFERMKGKIEDKQKHEMYLNFIEEHYEGNEKLLKQQLKMANKSLREMKQEIFNDSICSYLYSQNVSSYAIVTPLEIKEFYKLNQDQCIEPSKYSFDQFEISNDKWSLQTELISNIDNNDSYIKTKSWIMDHAEIKCTEYRDVIEPNIHKDLLEKLKKLNVMQFDRKPIKDGDFAYFFCLKNRTEPKLLELNECAQYIEDFVRSNKWNYIKNQWMQTVLNNSYFKIF